MDDMDTANPHFSVEAAAEEEAILYSQALCPFYDSEPQSESESDLSIIFSDDEDYHSLPPSPMASPPPESHNPFPLDSGPMDTDALLCDEFENESGHDADLVEWVERASHGSLEQGGDDMDEVWENPESLRLGQSDPTGVDTHELQLPGFQVNYTLEEIVTILEHNEDRDSIQDWAEEMAEFSDFPEMDTDTPLIAEPYSPDTQFVLENFDMFNDCLPPNPNQQPDPDSEPDWDAASTASSSIPDLEDLVRNMELEVLLAMHNIYEGDPEMEFFRHFLELDRAMRGGPATSKSAVESLPDITADESMLDLQCAVCKEYVMVGESLKILPCSHDYHGSCILPWLGMRNTCPLCRYELPTEEQSYESWRARQENQDGRMAYNSGF